MERLIVQEIIEQKIFLIRGEKVMLSTHLAELYGVGVKALVQAVKRNIARFPADFMFQLTWDEARTLRSQFVTLKSDKDECAERLATTSKRGKHIKYLPYAFTEQGVAMLSSVLKSHRAIQVNIAIMRAFVRFREILLRHRDLPYKLNELERKIEKHDEEIKTIFEAIRQLMIRPKEPKRRIGFHA